MAKPHAHLRPTKRGRKGGGERLDVVLSSLQPFGCLEPTEMPFSRHVGLYCKLTSTRSTFEDHEKRAFRARKRRENATNPCEDYGKMLEMAS